VEVEEVVVVAVEVAARVMGSRVPKGETRSGARGDLAMLNLPRAKIEHCELNTRPFNVAFSGIVRVCHFVGDVILLPFFCIFLLPYFPDGPMI
jgi:hypothetical protein